MPEWLIERGIGETRFACIEEGEIVAARVQRDGVIAAGAVLEAKLLAVAPRVLVRAAGETLMLPRGVSGVSEGRTLKVEVVREALGGSEPWKRGLARVTEKPLGEPPPAVPGREARIEGWNDLLEDARSGILGFEGGELRIEPTAAMTMIDVDGWLVPDRLAPMAAWAIARAIRRLDLGGSIGIDFPTLKDKGARAEIDSVLEAYLPRPFERTAMNGFGFVQIVRPKARPSLIDLARDRAPFEARALLRRAGAMIGPLTLHAHPAVIDSIRPEWIGALERQVGGAVTLRGDPALAMSAGHAQ